MKERPILFRGDMVRAILENRKTQTRRIVKPQPTGPESGALWWKGDQLVEESSYRCPYGQPGDRLWVREIWCAQWRDDLFGVKYKSNNAWHEATYPGIEQAEWYSEWRPSIFMPRWASRITLEITGVRVERLHDISEEDAKAEGAERGCWCNDGVFCDPVDDVDEKMASYRSGYGFLWESINGKGSWNVNPWVWCISFKRV